MDSGHPKEFNHKPKQLHEGLQAMNKGSHKPIQSTAALVISNIFNEQ